MGNSAAEEALGITCWQASLAAALHIAAGQGRQAGSWGRQASRSGVKPQAYQQRPHPATMDCHQAAGDRPVGTGCWAKAHVGIFQQPHALAHLMMDPIQTTVRKVISTPVTTTGSTRLSYGPSSFWLRQRRQQWGNAAGRVGEHSTATFVAELLLPAQLLAIKPTAQRVAAYDMQQAAQQHTQTPTGRWQAKPRQAVGLTQACLHGA
jgi:hypothetical protein